jgi:competence protein ComEC
MLASGADLQSDVLKAGHPGAASSTGVPFLAAVAPEVVVISVGADNRYGHPAPALLERVTVAGAAVVRTDEMGTLELVVDREGFWLEKAR